MICKVLIVFFLLVVILSEFEKTVEQIKKKIAYNEKIQLIIMEESVENKEEIYISLMNDIKKIYNKRLRKDLEKELLKIAKQIGFYTYKPLNIYANRIIDFKPLISYNEELHPIVNENGIKYFNKCRNNLFNELSILHKEIINSIENNREVNLIEYNKFNTNKEILNKLIEILKIEVTNEEKEYLKNLKLNKEQLKNLI